MYGSNGSDSVSEPKILKNIRVIFFPPGARSKTSKRSRWEHTCLQDFSGTVMVYTIR